MGLYYQGGTNTGVQVRLHPYLPVQNPNSVWTFDGTFPPKLLVARYGEPVLFRHHNALPISASANAGFGAHTITTHLHNGHQPAESDGFTGAYYFPGQYYDYRWPMILAGQDSINTGATSTFSATPNNSGANTQIKGDWRETMSTQWFHDHMVDFTAQNVYKGNAAMVNLYSAIDRGKENYLCRSANVNNPNLCLPSGTMLHWGNRDYDVNLMMADKAWDNAGQLKFNVFNTDGFLGDRATVNWNYKPWFQVRPRRYRFRLLNASVSRLWKVAVVNQAGARVPFHMIANDGNIMEHAVRFPNAEDTDLPFQGIGERFDIIIDFTGMAVNTRIYLVNLSEHDDGRRPERAVPLAEAIGNYQGGDPVVGKFLEFRVMGPAPLTVAPADTSMNPAHYVEGLKKMIQRPAISSAELATARHRTFEFGRSGGTDLHPWTIKTDGGQGLTTDVRRISASPDLGALEIWHFSSSDGWTHPVHVHFEEGQILSQNGAPPRSWEKWSRKDLFTIGGQGTPGIPLTMDVAFRFREFMGTFLEHCHNTQHEDRAMLLRWDIKNPGQTVMIPTPMPTWEGVGYENSYALDY